MADFERMKTELRGTILGLDNTVHALTDEQGPDGTKNAGAINIARDARAFVRTALFYVEEAQKRV